MCVCVCVAQSNLAIIKKLMDSDDCTRGPGNVGRSPDDGRRRRQPSSCNPIEWHAVEDALSGTSSSGSNVFLPSAKKTVDPSRTDSLYTPP